MTDTDSAVAPEAPIILETLPPDRLAEIQNAEADAALGLVPVPPPQSPESQSSEQPEMKKLTDLPELVGNLLTLSSDQYAAVQHAIDPENNIETEGSARHKSDKVVQDLISEVKLHIQNGHDPLESVRIQLEEGSKQPDTSGLSFKQLNRYYKMKNKERQTKYLERCRRMGRAAMANWSALNHDVGVNPHGYEFRQKMFPDANPLTRFAASALANFGIETRRVRAETRTLREYRIGKYTELHGSREHTRTSVQSPGLGALLRVGSDRDPLSWEELTSAAILERVGNEERQSMRKGKWVTDWRTGKVKWKKYIKTQKSKPDVLSGWQKGGEDSYEGSKPHKHAVTDEARYDRKAEHHHKTHDVFTSLRDKAKHSPRLTAWFTEIFGRDYSNPNTSFGDLANRAVADRIKAHVDQLNPAVNLDDITTKFSEYANQLDGIIDHPHQSTDPDTLNGKIWLECLSRNDGSATKARQELRTLRDNLRAAPEALRDKAVAAKEQWEEDTEFMDMALSESEVETSVVVNGERKKRKQRFTFNAVKREEIGHASREYGMRPGGAVTRFHIARGALARSFKNTEFIEVRVHIYDEGGKEIGGGEQRDPHKTGRVIGYIDPRTMGLIPTQPSGGGEAIPTSTSVTEPTPLAA
jgi:hypothetical protein